MVDSFLSEILHCTYLSVLALSSRFDGRQEEPIC